MNIVLVGCGAKKLDRPAPAGELYIGTLFQAARAWAEKFGDRWYILSAMHAMVPPEQQLYPYNVSMADLDANRRAEWAGRVISMMEYEGLLVNSHTWTFLAGKAYIEPLLPLLEGLEIKTPLAGMGIGKRTAWLQAAVRMNRPFGADAAL
jgi:hypothetical protein